MPKKPISETAQARHRGRRAVTAFALAGVACASVGAGHARADVLPAGGGFTAPLLYSASGSCGGLCTITGAPVSIAGNTVMLTSYTSLLGVLGSSSGTETLNSPSFTWSGSVPAQASLSFQRQADLGGLLGSVTPTIAVDLVNATTGTTSQLDSVAVPSDLASLQTVTSTVDPDLIVPGDQLQLRVVESFTDPGGVLGTATVGLDNIGLDLTAATSGTGGSSGGSGGSGGAGSSGGSGSASGAGTVGSGGGQTSRGARCLVITPRTSPARQRMLRLSARRVTPRRPLRIIASRRATANAVVHYRLGAARVQRLRDRTIVVGFPVLRNDHRLVVTVAFSRSHHASRRIRVALHAKRC